MYCGLTYSESVLDELNLVKKEFSKCSMPLPLSQPWYAGHATWAHALKRIDTPMKVIMCVCNIRQGTCMFMVFLTSKQKRVIILIVY